MVDLLTIQTIGVIVAAFSFVVGVANNILISRRDSRNRELTLKNQEMTLETRQAQMFMNIYSQVSSKEFMNAWYYYLKKKWSSYNEFIELTEKDPEFLQSFGIIASFMEGLGVLVKEKLLPIRMVALLIAGTVRGFWEKVGPINEEIRAKTGYRRNLSESEYLYGVLIQYLDEHSDLQTSASKWASIQ